MRSAIFRHLRRRFTSKDTLLDRRAFLRSSLLAAAGTYLSGCAGWSSPRNRPRADRPRVVVVGAGFGGLACAYELRFAGYDVTVLEARKRLGGRVHTLTDLVPGKTLEAGASLIGENHVTWQTYARRFGLELIDITIEPEGLAIPIVLDGRRLEAAEAEALDAALETVEQAMAAESASVPDWRAPWDAPRAAELDTASLGSFLDALGLEPEQRRLVEVVEANNNVAPTARQSLLGMLSAVRAGGGAAYFTESEVYRCRGGNHQLTEALAREIGEERIHRGTPVQTIAWHGEEAERVSVTDAAGTVYEAEWVVLAVPPTLWDRITFEPGLPSGLVPTFGPAVKILAPVDEAYWEKEGWSQYGLGDGLVAMTWDGSYRQSEAPPAGLVGFSGATAAEALLAVPPERRQEVFAEQLDTFFPGFREHQAADAAFVRWPEDPFTRTGYSSPAPGVVTNALRRIDRGLGPLCFAGEHASPGFFGYMEGGLESGARLAKRIAEEDGETLEIEPKAAAGG